MSAKCPVLNQVVGGGKKDRLSFYDTLNMRYKRQAIRDVGKFTEVLRDRASHSDGGKRQGPICRKILIDIVSGGEQKFELVIAMSCSFSSPFSPGLTH